MKMMQWMGSLLLWLRVDCCRCSFWIFYIIPPSRGTCTAPFLWGLCSESFKAVNLYRKCSLSIFTHACKHLRAPFFYLWLNNISISAFFIYGRVWSNSCDRCEFLTPMERTGEKAGHPPPPPTLSLYDALPICEACLLPCQRRKSRKCWERKLYLAALLWLALAEKWNPDPRCSPRARTSFPVLQHPGLGNTVH